MRETLKFLTWLDVNRVIRRETQNGRDLPSGVSRIECFSDALEVSTSGTDGQMNTIVKFKDWFKNWYLEETNSIQLDLGDALLPVEFTEESINSGRKELYPSWSDISYLSNDSSQTISDIFGSLRPFEVTSEKGPSFFAFYSFKGGSGRTLHLAAHWIALLEKAAGLKKKIKTLIIDADLEAPGLTYWDKLESNSPNISFIDFLEIYHYSPINIEDSLKKIAEEIRKSGRQERGCTSYFLPACIDNNQLLDTPILPEHLSRGINGRWACSDAIYQLGQELDVDYILVDLRAGLSEISSPILFDPRVQRILITPASEQSISGMSLVLEQISHITPSDMEVAEGKYFDPSIIISLLTKEIKELAVFEDFQERLLTSYQGNEREPLEPRNLEIRTSDFAQELMNINSWSEAAIKLQGTSVMRIAQEWASTQLTFKQSDTSTSNDPNQRDKLDDVRRLRDICKAYEFAEAGEGKELLITEPIRNLAQSFTTGIPRAISIGAKGAGKTFMYLQIARFKYWENFLEKVLGTHYSSSSASINIYPLLQPAHVEDPAREIISEARNEVFMKMGTQDSFNYSDCRDRIFINIAKNSFNNVDWSKFWISEIANAVCSEPEENGEHTLLSVNRSLQNRNLKFTFLIDGLEDIFTEVSSNVSHRIALKELLDIPRRLLDIRQISFGIIILVRRDFLRYLFDQNLEQFESQYKNYDLYWNEESFLRLVFWICSQAEIIGAQNENGDQLSREEIRDKLQKLWGMKLGADNSREASTSNWIFAALTDFKGRIQARDIVRILYNASSKTMDDAKVVQFEKWSVNRILPPQSIRDSLKPCSERKVSETKQEYPQFKTWLESIASTPSANLSVPFDLDDAVKMGIDQSSIKMLEDIGAIYGDLEKDGTTKFYMPEIFRAGLGFTLLKGARPRVLVLQRKALSKR